MENDNDGGYISELKLFISPSERSVTAKQLWKDVWNTIASDERSSKNWNTDDNSKLGFNGITIGPFKKDSGGRQHDLAIAVLHNGVEADQVGEVFGEFIKPVIADHSDAVDRIVITRDDGNFSTLDLSD